MEEAQMNPSIRETVDTAADGEELQVEKRYLSRAQVSQSKVIVLWQIDQARSELKFVHELDSEGITKAYPLLAYIDCRKKKEEPQQKPDMMTTVLEGYGKVLGDKTEKLKQLYKKPKLNLDIKNAESDPIMKLGYGIVAYRNTLWVMIWAFIVFTILAIPSLIVYDQGTGYSNVNPKLLGHEKQSLGNLGYASTQCNQVSVGVGVLTLTCPYGVIGSITDYGVNDAKSGV